ncbi:sugar phosphate isomerase/epimerase family protein [Algoriphagus sp. PAP.12]|uniref:sugar phosphate isomerase/epimerase family protein n=1 Tax=Algoriphagus sp. PAP.12 TaxID=2996678 RepID=UPI00227A49CD|nr:TIM barrel protein [Algoriphagus sp. PAP.12]
MQKPNFSSRRTFLKDISLMTGALALPGSLLASSQPLSTKKMKLGLVTYLWGKDWDVPTLIKNCTAAKIYGVELRVDHAHGVGLNLTQSQRADVKKRFDDSKVEIVGMGTNFEYHSPDPAVLKDNIEKTKQWLQLSKDVGGSGVKVKPNAFPQGVSHEKTLEQIGKALNELGQYALDMGQVIRLEVHGHETQNLPNIKVMMDYVENKGTGVCWNCNQEDLDGQGLEYNFNLVKDRLGDTVHVREMNLGDYPYQELMSLFSGVNYNGWILLECRTDPDDKVKAMIEQREVFEKMLKNA